MSKLVKNQPDQTPLYSDIPFDRLAWFEKVVKTSRAVYADHVGSQTQLIEHTLLDEIIRLDAQVKVLEEKHTRITILGLQVCKLVQNALNRKPQFGQMPLLGLMVRFKVLGRFPVNFFVPVEAELPVKRFATFMALTRSKLDSATAIYGELGNMGHVS